MHESKLNLCIHGHFYQPPRENPWLEDVEPQESATPYPNWNERIHQECYWPNVKARVLDEKGNIVDIVNNFENISFNFGPTLLSWIEAKHPETYRALIEADQHSRAEHHGHGNALAQTYNHMIMPLAHPRDKVTQVQWGLYDFQARFKREAESIWLPETACNEETIEVLIEAGMKFLILEPHQAEAVRPLGKEEWKDVSSGLIDPKKPYRYFSKQNPKRFIDIFFYDGPVSKAVGFDDVLFEAKKFMNRILQAVVKTEEPQLIAIATDGETYGHHRAFGERALAYLLQVEAPRNHFQIVNFGEHLAKHPPQSEVRLKCGQNGEGTSWSCAHGVRRWRDHCGCRGDGPAEWNQNWRKPLREALDWLREKLTELFEKEAGSLLKDVWAARNDYIRLVLDRSEKNITEFFRRHGRHALDRQEIIRALKHLEAQRHAMLMYTSCGWFFSELSGIETIQIMEYAARAVQLAKDVSGWNLEPEFLDRLALAKSNLPEFRDGRFIYERFIRPRMMTPEQIASFYGLCSMIDESYEKKEAMDFYSYRIRVLHQRRESFGELNVNFGRVLIGSKTTLEESDLFFISVRIGSYDFRCSVKPFAQIADMESLEREFFEELQSLHIVELLRKMDKVFGEKYFSLKNLPLRERAKMLSILTHEAVDKISAIHQDLYDENRRMSEIFRSVNLPIPEEMRYAAEHTLKLRLRKAAQTLAESGFNLKKATPFYRILEDAAAFGVELKKEEVVGFLSRELYKRTAALQKKLEAEAITECINILKLAKKIKVELYLSRAQEHVFTLLKKWSQQPDSLERAAADSASNLLLLMSELKINPEKFKRLIQMST